MLFLAAELSEKTINNQPHSSFLLLLMFLRYLVRDFHYLKRCIHHLNQSKSFTYKIRVRMVDVRNWVSHVFAMMTRV